MKHLILILVLLLGLINASAQVPTSLPAGTTVIATDKFYDWQAANSSSLVLVTGAQLQAFLLGGLTVTPTTGTLTLSAGKTLTAYNSLSLSGTDGAAVNFGAGGTISAVGYSNNYGDLTGLPTIPAAQVNADWNATSGLAQILNKPTLVASVNGQTGAVVTDPLTVENASFTLAANNSYVISSSSGTTNATLPPSPALGAVDKIFGAGSYGWNLYAGAGATITFDGTSTATSGYLAAAAVGACVDVRCIVSGSSPVWIVYGHEATLTVH